MKPECKNILVIDDDPAICQTMKDVLEIYGYNVITATDGVDGIVKIKEMKSNLPCLIILDLMMPKMNGWGFLDFHKSIPALSSVPVVICSAYESSARVMNNPVLVKPVQLNSLVGAVKAFCA